MFHHHNISDINQNGDSLIGKLIGMCMGVTGYALSQLTIGIPRYFSNILLKIPEIVLEDIHSIVMVIICAVIGFFTTEYLKKKYRKK